MANTSEENSGDRNDNTNYNRSWVIKLNKKN